VSVIAKIKARIAELMKGGSTRADAMRAAAKEFHAELAEPVPIPTENDKAVSRLDLAVAGIRARLFPDAKDDDDLSDRLVRAETRKSVMNSLNAGGSSARATALSLRPP